jgi:predicted DNA-binding transcriptional regulator YafY
MNRTDRLYALVEELRAVAPRPLSARRLAERFEVSARTIERDLGALQESGVPIYAEPGRRGGYTLDKSRTLPPVNVTPAEAVAIAVALGRLGGGPFADGARSALHKLLAVMPTADVARAEDLARRVHLISRAEAPATSPVPRVIADALAAGRLLRIGYIDRGGAPSTRAVEPVGYVGGVNHWYLLGWCRLRGGLRAFRLDRIVSVEVTEEVVEPRPIRPDDLDIPRELVTQVTLGSPETPTGRCRADGRALSRRQPTGLGTREETADGRDDQRHRLVRDRH